MGLRFEDLQLDSRILDGILDMGYKEMTPIQEKAIPIALEGHDLIAASQTGTGKTAAFLIPILDKLVRLDEGKMRALILTPTRELALQIEERLSGFAYHAGITSACVVGGLSFAKQEEVIRKNVEIVIATPGRMIDHLRYDHVDFSSVEFLVLDEADRMLDMGFLPSVTEIVKKLPTQRQTFLFSATIDNEVKKLARDFQKDPKEIQIGRKVPVEAIRQRFFAVTQRAKVTLTLRLIRIEKMESVIIFARTKRDVIQLEKQLKWGGVKCDLIHGDREQEERTAALEAFRRGTISVLVATDIASRGLDITDVSHVINFDIPKNSDDYIHRVGRTARAQKTGEAITFVTPDDGKSLLEIEKGLGKKITMDKTTHLRAPRPPERRKKPRTSHKRR